MPRTDALKTDQNIECSDASTAALPSSADFPDQKLIESTISHIRRVLGETVGRGMEEIGRCLLRNVYDDDPKLYFSASPKKSRIAAPAHGRCESMELPVSRSFLANALRMAVIARNLPRTAAFHKLPLTHRRQLLRIKNPERVEFLASKAISERLTVQKLRNVVDKDLEKEGVVSVRGRRRIPRVLRVIGTCLQGFQDEQTGKFLIARADILAMTGTERVRAQSGLVALQSAYGSCAA